VPPPILGNNVCTPDCGGILEVAGVLIIGVVIDDKSSATFRLAIERLKGAFRIPA
jgi:hypothetical protein